ncbi:MAG: hypothetical protein K2N34_06985 [Lachnospiraceae bacterium]|nr:hypothetical protein [Lachnospiraceae bacterium]
MNDRNSAGKQLLLLLLGILMCGGGLFLFSRQINVVTYGLSSVYGRWGLFGGRGIPGGMILIPLIIGIVVWVIFPDSFAGKLITMIGVLFIIFGVISSISLEFRRTSLYELVLMLILIFGGGALALRILFIPDLGNKKRDRSKFDEMNDKFN